MMLFKKIISYVYDFVHPVDGEIWLLHSVTDEKSSNEILSRCEITPLFLEYKIKQALENGYHFVSMNDVFLYVKNKKRIKKFIALSFDDGYENNYTVAYPILKKYNVPFCVFVTTGYMTGKCNINFFEKKKMLNIEQIKCLSVDPLCTIGAHTISHPHLNDLKQDLQLEEIRDSRVFLQGLTKQDVSFFAPPYGDYSSQIEELCKKCGFLMSVAAWGTPIRHNKKYNIYNTPRVIIENTM